MTKQSRPLGLSGQYFELGQAWVLGLALCLILGRPILSAQAADPMGENQLTRIDLLIPQEGIQALRQSFFSSPHAKYELPAQNQGGSHH